MFWLISLPPFLLNFVLYLFPSFFWHYTYHLSGTLHIFLPTISSTHNILHYLLLTKCTYTNHINILTYLLYSPFFNTTQYFFNTCAGIISLIVKPIALLITKTFQKIPTICIEFLILCLYYQIKLSAISQLQTPLFSFCSIESN